MALQACVCPICEWTFQAKSKRFGRCPHCQKPIRFAEHETEADRRKRLAKRPAPALRPKRRHKPRRVRKVGQRAAYLAYLQSTRWKDLRRAIYERDGFQCRECQARDNLNAHHIHYRTLGLEDGRELVTLCVDCHLQEHRVKLRKSEKRWRGTLGKIPSTQPKQPLTDIAPTPHHVC